METLLTCTLNGRIWPRLEPPEDSLSVVDVVLFQAQPQWDLNATGAGAGKNHGKCHGDAVEIMENAMEMRWKAQTIPRKTGGLGKPFSYPIGSMYSMPT